MIHFFVLLKPLGKKKLNKDGEDKRENKLLFFPIKKSLITAMYQLCTYITCTLNYYKPFPEKSGALTFFLPNTRQIRQ